MLFLYADVLRQGALLTVLTVLAVLICCLGLIGLAAFTAERRTKEIGIRKAMGATSGNILKLLTWEFSKPVLLANLLAWPIGYFAMNRWLSGFASHIAIEPWMFIASGLTALAIAIATMLTHAFLVAQSKPAEALRYE